MTVFPRKPSVFVDLSQIEPKNATFFETFSSKHLHGIVFCYTFASAFENELDKPNEQNEACFSYAMAKVCIKRNNRANNEINVGVGSERKEFFEKIYINRQVVQEASLTLFIMHRLG